MRRALGLLGAADDAQLLWLRQTLLERGAQVHHLASQGLNLGQRVRFDGQRFVVDELALDEVGCWFVRHLMAPLPPAFEVDEDYALFGDWYAAYMRRRERQGMQLAWLLDAMVRGVPVINPPAHGSVLQLKTFQLARAVEAGLAIPRTLVTTDVERARAFVEQVRDAVYKPSLGGGPCLPLDVEARGRLGLIARAPVTLQERVRGTSVRVTWVGDAPVSCVEIPSDHLDYRSDPAYREGRLDYRACALPDDVEASCRRLLARCALVVAGLDLVRRDDGGWVFLEANPSPTYLDIERRAGHRITDAVASLLLAHLDVEPGPRRARPQPFVRYAYPFDAGRGTGGPAD